MMSLFAFSERPFGWPRFLAFLFGLAAIAALALHSGRPSAERPETVAAAATAQFEVLRIGRPADEVFSELRQIGLPWFLRRAGAKAEIASAGKTDLSSDVTIGDRRIGRYTEHVEGIDEDRSKIFFRFEPAEPALVHGLVGSLSSFIDDTRLMSVILKEHVRSELEGDDFDLTVLESGMTGVIVALSRSIRYLRPCPPPEVDDFPLCGWDLNAAIMRRAYEREAASAGSRASSL